VNDVESQSDIGTASILVGHISLPMKTRLPGLFCSIVCMIINLANLVELWLVTDRQTCHDSIYRTNIVSCNKNWWCLTLSINQQLDSCMPPEQTRKMHALRIWYAAAVWCSSLSLREKKRPKRVALAVIGFTKSNRWRGDLPPRMLYISWCRACARFQNNI